MLDVPPHSLGEVKKTAAYPLGSSSLIAFIGPTQNQSPQSPAVAVDGPQDSLVALFPLRRQHTVGAAHCLFILAHLNCK